MDTVFVIGAGGFLGRHVVRHLAARGIRVVATARPGSSLRMAPGVDWVRSDLAAGDTACWPGRYDTLVFLAQSARWREFPAGAEDMGRVNITAVRRAAEHAVGVGARRFINMSSGSVYGQTDRPAVETDPFSVTAPRSFYAASKLAAELLLEPYSAFLEVVQLRLFTPHGPGQDERMLLPLVAGKVRDGVPVDLHGPDGLLTNPTAVGDVAEAVRRCLSLDGSHILNLGGPEILSLRQMAEMMGRQIGREPTFNIKDGPGPVIVGDTTQLRKALKWAPPTRFEAGVREWLKPAGG